MISRFTNIGRSFYKGIMNYTPVVDITSENFESEVTLAEVPVIMDFYATWCGPCKILVPLLEDIIAESYDEVKLCKINVEEELELAQEYAVSSIPAVFGVVNDEVISSFVGLKEEEEIREFIDDLVEKM